MEILPSADTNLSDQGVATFVSTALAGVKAATRPSVALGNFAPIEEIGVDGSWTQGIVVDSDVRSLVVTVNGPYESNLVLLVHDESKQLACKVSNGTLELADGSELPNSRVSGVDACLVKSPPRNSIYSITVLGVSKAPFQVVAAGIN